MLRTTLKKLSNSRRLRTFIQRGPGLLFAQSESTCFLLTFPPEALVYKQLTQQPKTKGRRGVEHAAMTSFELTQTIHEKNIVKLTLKFNKRPKKNLESMNH